MSDHFTTKTDSKRLSFLKILKDEEISKYAWVMRTTRISKPVFPYVGVFAPWIAKIRSKGAKSSKMKIGRRKFLKSRRFFNN